MLLSALLYNIVGEATQVYVYTLIQNLNDMCRITYTYSISHTLPVI